MKSFSVLPRREGRDDKALIHRMQAANRREPFQGPGSPNHFSNALPPSEMRTACICV
jgi:hypothetical protein